MERPGSADPNGEKVAERTWDCPCHAWHLGLLRQSIVSGEPKEVVPDFVELEGAVPA
jgi:hypothetical protein